MACSQEPLPTSTAKDRTLSEEVYRILCKRVAKATYPKDRTGARFDAPCDGQVAPDTSDTTSPEALRFKSIVQHRDETITVLNEWFGRAAIDGGATFADGELDGFLSSIVPFYDKPFEFIPRASRGIAGVMDTLIDPNDTRSQDVLKTLARIGPRKGYRPAAQALGAVRPILAYERLDQVAKLLLSVLGTDGKGNAGPGQPGLLAILRGTALELALPAEPKEDGDSTLDILLRDLLFQPLEGLKNAPSAFIVLRDDSGSAKVKNGGQATGLPTPFPVAGEALPPGFTRTPDGRAQDATGGDVYEYLDMGKTVFAGMVRETKGIASPQFGNAKSALENLGAGLHPIYGTSAFRKQTFGKNDFAFEGADLKESPLFDLAHAVAMVMRYPETEDLLALLAELIKNQEDASVAVPRLLINLHDISEKPQYASAHTVGADGSPDSPTEVWDDVIGVGMRMLSRPGMIEALIRSFADATGKDQGKLFGTWMRYRDDVTYVGNPIMPNGTGPDGSTGAYSADQRAKMNTILTQQYGQPVDRTQPDLGMNRSVWQRTLSLINALNGKKICNKTGASLTVGTNLIGNLKFPLEKDSYAECELFEIGNAIEIYSQAVIGAARITVKDPAAFGLGAVSSPFGIVSGVDPGSSFGKILEVYSDITGFTDTPNGTSLARLLFAPNNQFMSKLLDPLVANQGVEIRSLEPNALFPMEIKQAPANGASLISAGVPLMKALDSTELRDVTDPTAPKLKDGYMFGHMLSALHKHWPSRSNLPCTPPLPPGLEGCSEPNKASKFYAAQSNVVSYEPMISEMLVDADATGILQRSAAVVDGVTVNGKKGLTIIANFLAKMLTPDEKLAYRDGRTYALTNSCQDAGNGMGCVNDVGAVLPKIPPIYLVLDALKGIDTQFKKPQNAPSLDAWHAARSALVDQFLKTDVTPDGKTFLLNQNGRQLGVVLAQFGADQLKRHREKGDIEEWSDGLTDRMLSVLDHPITAGAITVLDALYKSPDASRELAAVTAHVTDADKAPRDFAGMLTAIADTAEFVSTDPDLTPVVQFAALVAAPNAFDSLDSQVAPDVENSAAYAAVEVSRAVMSIEGNPSPSPISRLLKNLVSLSPRGESPVETMFDIVAEVNRGNPLENNNVLLNADDYRAVFSQLQKFMTDGDRGLERLYKVIQGRKAD